MVVAERMFLPDEVEIRALNELNTDRIKEAIPAAPTLDEC